MFPLTSLPLEVMLRVFDHLDVKSLNIYQRVSTEWYSMCHTKFLHTVQLKDDQINHFLDFIDRNPNEKQAVYKIELYPTRRISLEQFEKLFFQFPNLTSVYILCSKIDDVHELDHEFCSDQIIKKCQKLTYFNVHVREHKGDPGQYYNALYKMRSILTVLDMLDQLYVDRRLEFEDYLDSFPRVQRVCRKLYGTYTPANKQ